jgi:hypothetical protein
VKAKTNEEIGAEAARIAREKLLEKIKREKERGMNMAKAMQAKEPSVKIPMAIADGVPNLKLISGKMKTLLTVADYGDCSYEELLGFQHITQSALQENVKQLDGIITDIQKYYGMNED